MMEERRLLHTLPPTMVVVEIRSCNSMCLLGPHFTCHAIRLCHTTGRLSHGLAAIALYSHFVFQWVLCVQLQTCPCCPVPSMLLERLMLLSRAISDLHHQLKHYNIICPHSQFSVCTHRLTSFFTCLPCNWSFSYIFSSTSYGESFAIVFGYLCHVCLL